MSKKAKTEKTEAKIETTPTTTTAPPVVEVQKPRDPAEVAATWAKQEASLILVTENIGTNVWQAGKLLNEIVADGTWAHVKDDKGNHRFPKFPDVIESLTPWSRAYGYQAMALADPKTGFSEADVRRLGIKKALRLAAAIKVSAGRPTEAQIKALLDKAPEMSAAAVEEQIGLILEPPQQSLPAAGGTTAPATKPVELRGHEWGCRMEIKDGLMIGFMEPDPATSIRLEIRKEGGVYYSKVAILNVAPKATDEK